MKTRNPYKPLRFAQGVSRAVEACPPWRMVTSVVSSSAGSWWTERRGDGSFERHDGVPPMQSGVVCDESWVPVQVETRSGRPLPVLRGEWEDSE